MFEDEDDDELIRDGEHVRVPLHLMDSTQREIAQSQQPPLNRTGFIFDSSETIESRAARQRSFDIGVLEMTSGWKGGPAQGDYVTILGDKQMVVTDYDPQSGKLRMVDADAFDGEVLKQAALDTYERDLVNAWRSKPEAGDREGGSCVINGQPGRFITEGGQLVCKPLSAEPDDEEWKLAGPLGDSGQDVKDQAYAEYLAELESGWRR